MKKFELPALPYSYDALTPIISAEVLHYHHDQHHRSYVNKLNELLPGSGFEENTLEEIIKKATGPLVHQAGQHWNHSFLWKSMSPRSANRSPEGSLSKAIESNFKDFEFFKKAFEKEGTALFGSGWLSLVLNGKGELQILALKDGDTPIHHHFTPLFTCDLWEHAYYVDYRNERAEYISLFWSIVNWRFAESNFETAITQKIQSHRFAS